MNSSSELPLVSFVLVAYNQAGYIREAIESALAQVYSPLEIVLSDDCSSDNTFECMKDMVKNYVGPHTIKLNRNNTNLGLSRHIQYLSRVAEGELIVISAGDDISDAIRTSVLVRKWLDDGRKDVSIFSGMREIDRNTTVTGKVFRSELLWNRLTPYDFVSKNIGVFGASHAWSKNVLNKFPPMHSSIVNEDHVIPFRASLLDGVLYVDENLVSYRANIGLASNYSQCIPEVTGGKSRRHATLVKRPYSVYVQKLADIKWMNGRENYLLKLTRSRRADYLLRYWIVVNGVFTRKRIIFFLRRCRFAWILREVFYKIRG